MGATITRREKEELKALGKSQSVGRAKENANFDFECLVCGAKYDTYQESCSLCKSKDSIFR